MHYYVLLYNSAEKCVGTKAHPYMPLLGKKSFEGILKRVEHASLIECFYLVIVYICVI